MEKFQKTITSREQSKKLLRMGLTEETADMFCVRRCGKRLVCFRSDLKKSDIKLYPVWTLGRLIDMYLHFPKGEYLATNKQIMFVLENVSYIDRVINEMRVWASCRSTEKLFRNSIFGGLCNPNK